MRRRSRPDFRHPIEGLDAATHADDAQACPATMPVCGASEMRASVEAGTMLRDVRDAGERAETRNPVKDEWLATVSHELRTPLNVIHVSVEVLRHSTDSELRQQAIDAIDRSAWSLLRMVDDILDASLLATGKLRVDAMPVDLAAIVTEVAGTFGMAASTNGIALETDGAVELCIVQGDAERLRQILSNLLSNALKFTPRGGRVTVCLARCGEQVMLTVADTGQGIPAEFMPHVFEAFRHSDDSRRSSRSLGLGLSIVRLIAELHGGAVAVRSEGRDRGTTVTVTLPAGWQPT
ncbi:protein of unknown function [Burkholderia multivorans]